MSLTFKPAAVAWSSMHTFLIYLANLRIFYQHLGLPTLHIVSTPSSVLNTAQHYESNLYPSFINSIGMLMLLNDILHKLPDPWSFIFDISNTVSPPSLFNSNFLFLSTLTQIGLMKDFLLPLNTMRSLFSSSKGAK